VRLGVVRLLEGATCLQTDDEPGQREHAREEHRVAEDERALSGYGWPGNVRELENVVSRAVLRASRGVPREAPVVVRPDHLGADFRAATATPVPAPAPTGETVPLREAVDAFQRDLIAEVVARHGGNWAGAARALGLHRSNLHRLAGRLGLRHSPPKSA
jgi:anaerobic nitric oxide reductase transcription regulator